MGDRLPRRPTDTVEDLVAWVLLSAGLLAALVAVFVGWGVDTQAVDRGRAEATVRTRVDAVLLEDAPVPAGDAGASRGNTYVAARWVTPDGSTRTGSIPAGPGTPAGSTVPIWIDRSGAAAPAPIGPMAAAFLGSVCGVGVLVACGALLGASWAGARRVIDIRNSARWEREWERVGPAWSRHLR